MSNKSKQLVITTLLSFTLILSACSTSDTTAVESAPPAAPASQPQVIVSESVAVIETSSLPSLFAGRSYDYAFTVVDTMQTQVYDDNGDAIENLQTSPYSQGQDALYSNVQASYVNNGNGTITDLNTGLMWQQVPSNSTMNYDDAQAYVDDLNLDGKSDWRLPTIKELVSISNYNASLGDTSDSSTPFIDSHYFAYSYEEVLEDGQFWSNTISTNVNTSDEQLKGIVCFNFSTGTIDTYESDSNAFAVRAVRNIDQDHSYGENYFVNNDDGTVTDLSTGLTWQSSNDGISRDWNDSLDYAENLLLAGYEDWRMPNAKELHSIVDYFSSGDLAIDSEFFTLSGKSKWFYTSTTSGINSIEAYTLSFGSIEEHSIYDWYGTGSMVSFSKTLDDSAMANTSQVYLLCVRDNTQTTGIISSSVLMDDVPPIDAPEQSTQAEERPATAPSSDNGSTKEETTMPEAPSDSDVSGPPSDGPPDTSTDGTSDDSGDLPDGASATPPDQESGPPQQDGGDVDLSEVFDAYVTSGVLSEAEAEALVSYLEDNQPTPGADPLDGAVDEGIITQDQADEITMPEPQGMRK